MKTALLIIDPQNDFCHPQGTLYVPDADDDMNKLAKWITANIDNINFIAATFDWHQIMDVSHGICWHDKDGPYPPAFTQITGADIDNGIWKPNPILPSDVQKAMADYIKTLEQSGEFTHTIWPKHCIMGSWGASFFKPISDAMNKWSEEKESWFGTHGKGINPLTEHFGAFRAQVPLANDPSTQFNKSLATELVNKYDIVFIAGEAKSHCVANTIKQIMEASPDLVKKLFILEDCMSNISGFEAIADPIYNQAKEQGVIFTTTEEFDFSTIIGGDSNAEEQISSEDLAPETAVQPIQTGAENNTQEGDGINETETPAEQTTPSEEPANKNA